MAFTAKKADGDLSDMMRSTVPYQRVCLKPEFQICASQQNYEVIPICFETHRSLDEESYDFLRYLSARIHKETREPRDGEYFLQKLSIILQRTNAAAVFACMPSVETEAI